MSDGGHRTAVTVALIGVAGSLAAALIGGVVTLLVAHRGGPSASEAAAMFSVVPDDRCEVLGYRLLNDDPAFALFDVDTIHDPAFRGPVTVEIEVFNGPDLVASGTAPVQSMQSSTRVEVRPRGRERKA